MTNHDQPHSPEEPILSSSQEYLFEAFKPYYQALLFKPESLEDKAEMLRLKEGQKDPTERSLLFDRLLLCSPSWWGDKVRILRATEYDDRKNATDLIVEFLGDNNQLIGRLSVDTTVPNNNLERINTKLFNITTNIKAGRMGQLKYAPKVLDDNKLAFERARLVPQVIVGINPDTLEKICDDVKKAIDGKEQKSLKRHPFQLVILDSVLNQLKLHRLALAKYEELGEIAHDQKMIVDAKLNEMSSIIESVIQKKENPLDGPGVDRNTAWLDPISEYFQHPEDIVRKFT